MTFEHYSTISELNKEHGIYLVKDNNTGVSYVQKTLDVYNRVVFERIKDNPVQGIPKVQDIYEQDSSLIVIEEYVHGKTLEEIITGAEKLPESFVYSIAGKVCTILERLHSFVPPIIHRDIKP